MPDRRDAGTATPLVDVNVVETDTSREDVDVEVDVGSVSSARASAQPTRTSPRSATARNVDDDSRTAALSATEDRGRSDLPPTSSLSSGAAACAGSAWPVMNELRMHAGDDRMTRVKLSAVKTNATRTAAAAPAKNYERFAQVRVVCGCIVKDSRSMCLVMIAENCRRISIGCDSFSV